MAKELIRLVGLVCLIGASGLSMAEENRFGVEWDAAAVQAMSREERLAYQQQYKLALEEAARRAGAIPAEPKSRRSTGQTQQAVDNPGTSITYHSGALFSATQNGVAVGNQFDSALTQIPGMGTMIGPVTMSGSVTMVTVDMAAVGGGMAFVSLFDQLSGTSANLLLASNVPMVAGVNVITLAPPVSYVGSSFLAGVWNWTTGTNTLNLATGSVGLQGFHGMSINDIPPTGFMTLGATNAAVSVGGDVVVPVELMSFEITD